MMDTITEYATNPPTAVVVGIGSGVVNTFIAALPLAINIITVVYLTLLVVHKAIQLYREFKGKQSDSSE